MRYIKIKNNGLIDPEALHLVGASTKRNDKTKIGMFGSGNKYALAFFLREGYEPRCFAGNKEIGIETKPKSFRDQTFHVIHIDGKETSITTEMGKDWHFWQAMREVYCNAIDEGGCVMESVNDIRPEEGETHFYIKSQRQVMEFLGNFDNYFATNKKVLFECSIGRILEKTGTKANIYRKGVRCFETEKKSLFDYDFNDISIDENRLVRYFWEVEEKMWSLIYKCDQPEIILQVLHSSANTEFIEGVLSDISSLNASSMSDVFKEVVSGQNLAPKSFAGLLRPDEVHNHIIIPTKIFESIRGVIKDENVGDAFKTNKRGGYYREIDSTPLQDATLKAAKGFFHECNFDVNYPIQVCLFADKTVLGCADSANERILLSDVCLSSGINTVVITIIEEVIHLKYKVSDETRGFQTSIIKEFVEYMKKKNAFVI